MTTHTDWVRNSGVRQHDRAVHEHRSLGRNLELLTCLDQMQVVNLACTKVTLERRMLTEAACKADSLHPSWESSEHFLGCNDGEDVRLLGPEVLKYQTQKITEEQLVLREGRLENEEEDAQRRTAQAAGRN